MRFLGDSLKIIKRAKMRTNRDFKMGDLVFIDRLDYYALLSLRNYHRDPANSKLAIISKAVICGWVTIVSIEDLSIEHIVPLSTLIKESCL